MSSFRRWALVSLVFGIVAAWLSAGFYHPDEQFQILEFANMKLGRGVASQMPIEYGLALRSWLQPGFLYVVARILGLFGVSDPFTQAFFFRLFSAVLGWGATWATVASVLPRMQVGTERRALLVLSALLWFLPALHARTSSESWSGAVFFLGLALTMLREPSFSLFAGAGALFGLAYGLRFQSAFLALGAFAWWALIARTRPRNLAALVLGGLASVALGACVDRWGYGYWTSPAWNYFHHTLVEGHVNDTDTAPIWDYLRMSTTETWPLLGPLTLLACVVTCFRRPKDPLVWSAVPFLIVHHVIPHKELRFLFPLAQAGPYWLAVCAPLFGPFLLRAFIAWDVIALVAQTLTPANPRVGLWHAIAQSGVQTVYYRGTDDPYSVQGIIARFYRPHGLTTLPGGSDAELARAPRPFLLYYLYGKGAPHSDMGCTQMATEIPAWVEERLPRERLPNVRDWQLVRCD